MVAGTPPLPALTPAEVSALLGDGGYVVDVRPAADFADGHIPDAISIPLRGQFATWLGWLLPDTAPIAFVANPNQDLDDVVWPAYKIGYERLTGHLAGGMPAWLAEGRAQRTTRFVPADQAGHGPYLDVRQQTEYAAGHVPAAGHIELGDLAGHAADTPRGAIVACGHGERAMTAASLLERAGRTDLTVLAGGPADYAAAHRLPLSDDA